MTHGVHFGSAAPTNLSPMRLTWCEQVNMADLQALALLQNINK